MLSKSIGLSRLSVVVVAIAVVGAIAGCGSDADTDTGSTTTAGDSDSGLSGDPVKLGMIGSEIELPTHFAVTETAVDAINQRGGIEGRPVELITCDDKANPNVTSNCGRKMADEGVVAIVGGGAVNGNVLVPIFENAEIPSIGVSVADPQQASSEAYFFFVAGEGSEVIAAYSGQTGMKTSLFAVEFPETQALLEPNLTAAEEAGTPFMTLVEVPQKQADYAPIIASGKLDEADAAAVVVTPAQEAPLIKSALSEGKDPIWLLDAEPSSQVADAFGGTVTDTVYPSPFPPISPESDDPTVLQYIEDLEAGVEEGKEHVDEALAHPTFTEAEGWLAVQVVAQLVEEGKAKANGPDLLKALHEVDGLDVGLVKSWLPNVTSPDGFRGGNNEFNVIEVNDGKLTALSKEPVTTEDLVSGEVTLPPPAGLE